MPKIYSKHFISTSFPLSNGRKVIIHGTNKHELELPHGTPYCNEVNDTDWQDVLREYQETGRAPHLFGDATHMALIFEAPNNDAAFDEANDAPDVLSPKHAQENDSSMTEVASPKKPRKTAK